MDDCMEWEKCGQHGYGGKTARAHRVVFFLTNGWWPKVVRHTCDNKRCVNPVHLLGGTQKENIQDSIERGLHHFVKNKYVMERENG